MSYSATETNARTAKIAADKLTGVIGGGFKRSAHGPTIDARAEADPYRHPWKCSPVWRQIKDTQNFAWFVKVHPGAVNGYDVMTTNQGKTVSIADGGEVRIGGWTVGTVPQALVEEVTDKRILKSEIIIQTPRITASQSIEYGNFQGGRTINISTNFDFSIFNSVPRYHLVSRPLFTIQPEPDDLDFYEGVAAEPTYDEIQIATIWAIKPDTRDGDPDETWRLHVQQHQFWNLFHASRQDFGQQVEETKISFDTALAGGIGNGQLRDLLREQDDRAEQIRAFFAATKSKGEFWT
jgi:hypothetical protein